MGLQHISLVPAKKADYRKLIEVWEASVRATHHFLSSDDILFYRKLIFAQYFDLVHLVCAKSPEGLIIGFMGVLQEKLEMLFIDPVYRGEGAGKILVTYACEVMKVSKVDVNEQNEQAVGFYHRLGFKTVNRVPVDGMGKPFPVLHMQLVSS
ncbi:MAG: GNAT family N-acetyltransferase [Chitinophagaceae bacterium]|nr:MAG: GNAT family N-acetyltransferase [Chitinophagaceae bacterium]